MGGGGGEFVRGKVEGVDGRQQKKKKKEKYLPVPHFGLHLKCPHSRDTPNFKSRQKTDVR